MTARSTAWVRPALWGLLWHWETRRKGNSKALFWGLGFTREDAVRQAFAWASAQI